jgi:hypothetical protein
MDGQQWTKASVGWMFLTVLAHGSSSNSSLRHGRRLAGRVVRFSLRQYSRLVVRQTGTVRTLELSVTGKMIPSPVLTSTNFWLKSIWRLDGKSNFAHSLDGRMFTRFTGSYQLTWGSYRSDHVGICTYDNLAEPGRRTLIHFTTLIADLAAGSCRSKCSVRPS